MTPARDESVADGSATRSLARSGSLNFAGLVYYGAVNLVIVVVVSRGLGSGRAGELFTSIAVFNVLLRALVFGADVGLVRFISRWIALGRVREIPRLWIPTLLPIAAVATLAAVGLAAASDPLARAFASNGHEVAVAGQFRVLAPALPFAVVYFCLESASRGFGTMRPSVAIEKVGKATLQIALMSWAVATDAGPRELAAAWGLPIVLAFVAMAAWLVRRQVAHSSAGAGATGELDVVPDSEVHGHEDTIMPSSSLRRIAIEFWQFSGPRAPAGVFQSALLWSDAILIGAFASTQDAGVYAAATRFLVISTLMQLAIGQSLQPLMSAALARGERSKARDVFRSATAWAMLLTWPVLAGIMVFSPVLLRIYPADYARAASTLTLLSGAWMVAVACGPVDNVLLMSGRSWFTTLNVGIAFVVSVGLSIALIPPFGMFGAGVAWAGSLVINNVLPLYQVRRYVHITPFSPMMRQVLVPVAGFAAILLLARAALGATVPGMLVGVFFGLVVFATLAWTRRDVLRLADLAQGARSAGRRRA